MFPCEIKTPKKVKVVSVETSPEAMINTLVPGFTTSPKILIPSTLITESSPIKELPSEDTDNLGLEYLFEEDKGYGGQLPSEDAINLGLQANVDEEGYDNTTGAFDLNLRFVSSPIVDSEQPVPI